MKVGILILAAGSATRFGTDKRLAFLPDGLRVIDTLLANVRNSGLPFLVCLGESDYALASQLRVDDIPCVQCSRSVEGMGGTLAEGVGHISGWDGVLLALADMPWIKPDTYQLVAAQLPPGKICVPVHKGRYGHPVGFSSDFYMELASLGGDTGARRLLQRFAERVVKLPLNDAAIHKDIDTPSDLEEFS